MFSIALLTNHILAASDSRPVLASADTALSTCPAPEYWSLAFTRLDETWALHGRFDHRGSFWQQDGAPVPYLGT
jgi:hypothetical protein